MLSSKRMIRKEFEEKGFETFNSGVECWKVVDNLNCFHITPLDKVDGSSKEEKSA